MDSNMFMGLFIGAILALLSGIGIIAKVFIKPIINLNTNITNLQNSINELKNKDNDITEHISSQDIEIKNVKDKVEHIDHRLIKVESKFEVKRRV